MRGCFGASVNMAVLLIGHTRLAVPSVFLTGLRTGEMLKTTRCYMLLPRLAASSEIQWWRAPEGNAAYAFIDEIIVNCFIIEN